MFNIAIDGTSGSGKSTVAKALAKRLKIQVLNTGAIYRALTCAYIDMNLPEPVTKKTAKILAKSVRVEIKFVKGTQHTIANGVDYTARLHDEKISAMVADVAKFDVVRKNVRSLQRDFAKNNDCIIEGRDITHKILPYADVKLFVTASVDVRAKRRFEQLNDSSVTLEQIKRDLEERDYTDMHRKVSQLKLVKGAHLVDSSNMNVDETVDYIMKIIGETRRHKLR